MTQERSKAILVNPRDNVAVALEDIAQGSSVSILGLDKSYLEASQPIPFAHKIAIMPITKGQPVLKYGAPIAFALVNIEEGEWVHEHNAKSYFFCCQARRRNPVIPILGYQRSDGRMGIRNLVACIHTVECSSFVAGKIADLSPRVHTLGFPGCYSNVYAARMMTALACHPNVGAVLLVSLGCEGTDAGALAEAIRQSGRPVEIIRIQEAGGTERAIRQGKEIVKRMLVTLEETPRVEMSMSDLIIGTECGGSDATSGIAANPAVGHAFDMLVDAGATAIIEETLEMVGCSEIVAARGETVAVSQELRAAVEKAEQFSLQIDQFSIAPGNRVGGLTTVEEKSMGAFSKCGTRPIRGVIKVAQKPRDGGLYILDSVPDPSSFLFGYSNPNDSEGILDLISCGAHIIAFTTGRGSVIGSVIAPVLKICGNPKTYARMSGDMDVNAGCIITGEASTAEVGKEIFNEVVEVAAGKQTKSEALGHREYCIPYKHQDLCVNA